MNEGVKGQRGVLWEIRAGLEGPRLESEEPFQAQATVRVRLQAHEGPRLLGNGRCFGMPEGCGMRAVSDGS